MARGGLVKVTSVGNKSLLARIAAAGHAGTAATKKVLYQKAETISGKAKDEYVPVDWGTLKGTIHVEVSWLRGAQAHELSEPKEFFALSEADDDFSLESGTGTVSLAAPSESLKIDTGPSHLSASIVAGGPSAAYARAVHEHLSDSSPPSWVKAEAEGRPVTFTVGGPKFIERPFLEEADTVAEAIGKELDRRIKAG